MIIKQYFTTALCVFFLVFATAINAQTLKVTSDLNGEKYEDVLKLERASDGFSKDEKNYYFSPKSANSNAAVNSVAISKTISTKLGKNEIKAGRASDGYSITILFNKIRGIYEGTGTIIVTEVNQNTFSGYFMGKVEDKNGQAIQVFINFYELQR